MLRGLCGRDVVSRNVAERAHDSRRHRRGAVQRTADKLREQFDGDRSWLRLYQRPCGTLGFRRGRNKLSSVLLSRRDTATATEEFLAPMLGLVIVHDEAGVDDAGDPAEQRKQNAQDKAKDAARHQHGHGRKDDAKKVAERFHRISPQGQMFA
jgi:hypothetical protein